MNKPVSIGLIFNGLNNWLGGVQYFKNIILALFSLPVEVRSTFQLNLISNSSLRDNLSDITAHMSDYQYLEAYREPWTLPNLIRWGIARYMLRRYDPRFDILLRKAGIDFVYPYHIKGGCRLPYRSAAWIPDCQHMYLPQFFAEDEIRGRDEHFAHIAEHAQVIVFSSKSAQADFNKSFHGFTYISKILSPRVRCLPEWYGVDPSEVQHSYSLPDRFFFINNQFWQHKNHLVVFKALRILQDEAIYPTIVCTGNMYDYRNPTYVDVVLQTITNLGINQHVYLLGVVTRLDMISLMRRSLAVIQPSRFEGWSTVVEEARSLGKTIILSDIPIHREQDPPYSTFFTDDSAKHLAEIMADCWQTGTLGPNEAREAVARENNLREVQEFGYRFLEIARGT